MKSVRRNSILVLGLVALAIGAAEISRLVSETLSATGQSYSVDDTVGPFALANMSSWAAWAGAPSSPALFLIAHTIVVAGLYALSTVAALRLALGSVPAQAVITAVAVAEGVEILGSLLADIQVATDTDTALAGWIVAIAATLKWVGIVIAIAAGLRNAAVRSRIGHGILRGSRALYAQRLSLVVVLFLGLTSLVPKSGILEQLPDAQRAWLDNGSNGAIQAIIAIAALFITALALFVLGRQRARRFWLTWVRLSPPTRRSTYWWWFSAPIVVVATWLLLIAIGRGDLVDLPEAPLFVVAVCALPVVSILLRVIFFRRNRSVWSAPAPDRPKYERAVDVWTAGDILAGLVAAIAGLSLVRSFIAPALLSLVPDFGTSVGVATTAWIITIGGGVFGTVILYLSGLVTNRFDRTLTRPDHAGRLRGLWPILDPSTPVRAMSRGVAIALVALFAAAVLLLASMMIFPLPVSGALGIVGSTTIILAAWSIVIGVVTIRLQYRMPLEVFRLMHLRADPVLVMIVIIPALLSQVGGAPNLHALERDPDASSLTTRPTLTDAFQSWLGRTTSCDQTISAGSGTTTVRPLVIAASEGGGIRAATWTVDVFDKLEAASACTRSDVFLSSGVSGGSVGLAMFHGTGATASAATEIDRVSDPKALGVAVTGAFVGDTLAATTGLRIPSLDDRNGRAAWTWQDRSGLMESVWRDAAPQLASPWDDQPGGPTGYAILNSTAAGYGCRVLVSQLDLRAGDHSSTGIGSDGTAVAPNCQGSSVELPTSLDLQDVYGECPLEMDWSTAAMMSARFPLVSPAGRTSSRATGTDGPDCASLPDLQLIDGGYSEATGLGTLSDLSPALTTVIRNYNASVGAAGPYVVPVVMYLQNSSGADLTARPQKVNAELTVPLVGIQASKNQTDAATWLQRMSSIFGTVCPGGNAGCSAALASVRARTAAGVVVVAPTTRASVAAPLGWALSDFSRSNIESQVDSQLCVTAKPQRYGRLADLMTLLGTDPNC
ncbi:MAG TPA: hypothetical protein VGM94_04225 [Galbitalea sp.]|jgi:hypothetical protein